MIQVWYKAEVFGPKPWVKKRQPFFPYIIFVRENRTVSSYYDSRGIKWIKNLIVAEAKRNKNFFIKLEKQINERLTPIKKIYEKESTLDKRGLLKFIKDFEKAYPWIEAMWWVCEINSKELGGLDISGLERLRKKTSKISSGTDMVVRKSLSKIFPKIREFVHLLKIQEIKSGALPSLTNLKKRSEGYVFTGNRLYINKGIGEIEKKFNIHLPKDINVKVNEIKGLSANTGIVQGKVKKIMSHKDIDLIKSCEILVSPMTMPDFLSAIKKAAAVVTDEGGAMCHAAIICRELNKPCVVGTKIATKVLSDGDMIEVDADNGFVRRLD
jgi:pyruvate,water dikinase